MSFWFQLSGPQSHKSKYRCPDYCSNRLGMPTLIYLFNIKILHLCLQDLFLDPIGQRYIIVWTPWQCISWNRAQESDTSGRWQEIEYNMNYWPLTEASPSMRPMGSFKGFVQSWGFMQEESSAHGKFVNTKMVLNFASQINESLEQQIILICMTNLATTRLIASWMSCGLPYVSVT